MKKVVKFILVILLIIVLVLCIKKILDEKGNEKYGYWIKDSDYLYDIAMNYLKNEKHKSSYDKDKEDFQVFFDYEGFGIKEKDNKKYAYMYISEESYYVKHGKLRSGEKSYKPYKFVFENNEVIDYEIPKLGSDFAPSVKEMFPNDIENKVFNFNYNGTKISKDVDNHYSYLGSTIAFDVDYDEYIIAMYGSYVSDKENPEANTIRGLCIDGYGDIFEYTIPCNKDNELSVDIEDIDRNSFFQYQGSKISSMSQEDLEKLKNDLYNLVEKYSTTENISENKQLGFIKVLYKRKNNDMLLVDYSNKDFIDLIVCGPNSRKENISKTGKDILSILKKYNLSI